MNGGYWDLSFFSFVGRDTMDFLNKDCPEADATKLSTLQGNGKENRLRAYEKEIEEKPNLDASQPLRLPAVERCSNLH